MKNFNKNDIFPWIFTGTLIASAITCFSLGLHEGAHGNLLKWVSIIIYAWTLICLMGAQLSLITQSHQIEELHLKNAELRNEMVHNEVTASNALHEQEDKFDKIINNIHNDYQNLIKEILHH